MSRDRAIASRLLGGLLIGMAAIAPAFGAAATLAPVVPETPAQSVPESTVPGASGSGGSSEPLSDKLDRTRGVIHPPQGVDPAMPQEPPPEGRTPVIPPAGSRGESEVQPK